MKKYFTKTKTILRFSVWKTACLFAFLSFMGVQNANAQYTQIPDSNFEQALYDQGIDDILDGQVLTANISSLLQLSVGGSNIQSLAGIEDFTSLQYLLCSNNQLTSLNLNSLTNLYELDCRQNQFVSLDLTGVPSLFDVKCSDNQLTSLIVSGLPFLYNLSCDNNQLTTIDLSGLSQLHELSIQNNQLPSINISVATNLRRLVCNGNQLSSLNLSGSSNMTYLDCSRNLLTALNLSGMNLSHLLCASNQLTSLNLSSMSNLRLLSCMQNQITTLDLSGLNLLYYISCGNNLLTSLNLNGLTSLITLGCNNNLLPALNLNGLNNLRYVNCQNNQIPALNLIGLINLRDLNCSHNQLSTLDMNGLIAMGQLYCNNNQLTSLNVVGLTNMTALHCNDNQLCSINVGGLTNLSFLACQNNVITSLDVSNLMRLGFLNCSFNQLINLNLTGLVSLFRLTCNNNLFTSLNLSGFTNIYDLKCNSNNHLTCIQVNNVAAANANSRWIKDASASYSISCGVTPIPNTTPVFATIAPICSGETLLPLPTTSTNGIMGSWSPALNNLATTTYTFAPAAGQCAPSTTLTIMVNPSVTPIFSSVTPICSGETLLPLPTTSINGMTGTWSPALNNLATTTYTFTPATGQCAATTSLVITVNPSVTPIFSSVAPICSGETLLPLPTTSTNGITGTWFPTLNNLETTVYTFTPATGQCAATTSLTIVVNSGVTTTFTAVAPICYGDSLADLPTTSLEGITGTWSPAINKLATTTYTFTPDAGLCATAAVMTIIVHQTNPPYTVAQSFCGGATIESLYSIGTDVSWYTVPTGGTALIPGTYLASGNYYASQTLNGCESDRITTTVTVNPNVMPSFNQVAAICVGDTLAPLPTTSNNGITGTWSPALNNLATTTYEFTVDAGQCSEKGIMTIIVNSAVTPTFSQVPAICAGDTLAALPTTSNEGITGTWSPALNNLATTTYVFTPNASQCATTASMTITVSMLATPTFSQVAPICMGSTLANLPTASINGVHGYWLPAINNLATTTYTFNPKPGQCAATATMTVTVNPNVTPLFTQIAPIFCSGATLAPLPTTSINGVNGSWSPAMNNLATTTYTFTPNAGQCASTVTMTIVVQTVGTITGGNVTVCAPGTALDLNGVATVFTNSTTLTFNGNPAGSTIQWQRSFNYINTTGATPSWSAVANTATINNNVLINGNTLTISNLTSTIWYRVRVTNGSCFTYTVPVKVGVTPLARAGAITSLSSVCAGGNITFTSAAYTGDSIAWEVSTTSATAGFSIVAGANGLSFTMLNAPSTRFYVRAIVTSGACSMARSAVRTITVSPRSVGGTITGGGTVCSGANKLLRITGSTGSIQWMYSTDGISFMNVPTAPTVAPTFSTTSISGTVSSYSVNNITGLTYFKAVVRSGVCFSKDSNTVKYVVATAATAGTATAAASSVCPNTATTIDLVGSAGDIIWQRSTNPTAINPTWVNIAGAVSPTLNTGNLTVTTAYRARVTIGSCAPLVTSNVVLVNINCTTGLKQVDTPTEIAEPFSVVAYPNPSNNVFNFKVNGANDETVSILVFDMTGRQVDNKVVNANDIENLALGQNYSSGVYNVIVAQGINTKTVRLVKK